MRIHLTNKTVENLPVDPYKDYTYYWDIDLKGFGVRVLKSGLKSYIVRKSHRTSEGKVKSSYITLGMTNVLDCQTARSFAQTKLLQYTKNRLFAPTNAFGSIEKPKNLFNEDFTQPKLKLKIKFKDVCKPFIEMKQKEWSMNTILSYKTRLVRDLIPYFGEMYIDEIKKKHVMEFKHSLGSKPAIFKISLCLLKTILNFSIDMEYITANPATGITGYSSHNKNKSLSKEEIQKIFRYLSTQHDQRAHVLQVLILTGFRVSEILQSTWENITENEWIFPSKNSKSNKTTVLPLTEPLKHILKKQRDALKAFELCHPGAKKPPFVFFNVEASIRETNRTHLNGFQSIEKLKYYMTSFQVLYYFKKVTKKLKIDPDFTSHDLRHAFASILVNNGVPLTYIKETMGHSSVKMTERYTHFNNHVIKQTLQKFEEVIFSR